MSWMEMTLVTASELIRSLVVPLFPLFVNWSSMAGFLRTGRTISTHHLILVDTRKVMLFLGDLGRQNCLLLPLLC